MQRPRPETVTLDDVVITEELPRRSPRSPNWQAQAQAMQSLARQMASNSETLLQSLVDMALDLCSTGNAGVSELSTTANGEEVFCWTVLAGKKAQSVGETTRRDFSPCGVCLDQGTPQLFGYPDRYFTYLQEANTPIVEGLVLPLIADNHSLGTIWIMSHDENRHFDFEDVRVMTVLADFTARALLLKHRQTGELLAANAAKTAQIVERRQAEERFLSFGTLRERKASLTRALISNLPGGAAFVVDRDLRYQLAEGEALAIAGFQPEDLVGRTIFEVLPPELAASYEVLYRQALAGEPFEYEHNAHARWYISRGTPLREANGDVYAVLAVSYDITARKQVEAAQRESEAKLAQELADSKQLQFISSQLIQEENIDVLYGQILDAAIAVMRSDMGSLQMLYPERNELRLLAWKGFDPASAVFGGVRVDSDFPCSVALKTGKRVIAPDVEKSGFMAGRGDLDAYRLSGIKAVQSTPLLSRNGRMVGVISNHWHEPHQPSERDLGLLDVLARQAADLIERTQAEQNIQADLRDTQLLHALATLLTPEGDMQAIYQEIVATAIALTRADAGTVQILDQATQELLLLLAAQGFEQNMIDHFHRVNASSNTPCGITLATGDRAFVDFDVPESEDPDGSMRLHLEAGYLSAQSTPLITRSGKAIGMISTHWRKHHRPSDRELRFLDLLARQAADLIEQRQAEATLRESEEKYRSLFESIDEGYALIELIYDDAENPVNWRLLEVNPSFERLTGFSNAVGKTSDELYQVPHENWLEAFGNVAQTGEPMRFEQYVSGVDSWFDLHVSRLDADRRHVIMVFNNITERKRSEEQLRRAAQMDAFRVKLSDALRSLSDPVQIQAEACRLLGEHLGVDRAYYVEVNVAENHARVNQDYLRGDSPTLVGIHRFTDFGWIVPHLQRGETAIVEDTQSADIVPDGDKAAMAAIRIVSHISLPLIEAGALVGALCVTESVPRQWSAAEVELVRETAERIWATIIRARAEAALRESEIQRIREQAAHQEERQRAETLAELDRAKTLFFSNVSHEFRTPLTLLLAPLSDALSDRTHPLAQRQRERLELAQRNTNRLLKLVNTILDFSRIEAGRMEAVYEPTDLAMFTTELASVFRSAIERAGLRLIVDCPPLSEPVYVDREMWEKIVLNLLSNAFKFTFAGEIIVSLKPTNSNQVILQIQDTGEGIAPEHLPHLFERFYQVRGTKGRTHEGSGIGLALVDELVRLHGGTLEVSSTLGEGTCFAIALPLGTEHLPSDRLQVEGDRIQPTGILASTASSAASYVEDVDRWLPEEAGERVSLGAGEHIFCPPAHLPTCPPARILLVDDNADMREYLTRILSEHVQVEAVADGAAALAAIREQVPDLVLSDVMMPGLDGFGLLQVLRADPRTREVPIILLSARAGEEAIVEGLQAGADDYLIKPFSAQELVSRVNAHLQMAQLRGETLQEARSMIRSRDEMISTVSHELNTPLVSILGWTRMLRSNPLNPVMLAKALNTIERNATLQAKLVQDLLDMSRITRGKLRLNPQPIKLESVIETAIATVTQTAAAKGVNLTWQENSMGCAVVMGDGDRLGQVICNLLTNAIKFTPASGSVTLELSVMNADHSADRSIAEIRVTDTGIGISADFLPLIFDRFRQARDSNAAKGLGLGLAIAHHLVELHNSTIHAESAGEEQGASFIVRLPLLSPMPHDQSPIS